MLLKKEKKGRKKKKKGIMYHLQAGNRRVSHNNPQCNKLAADILN